jgi:hypothetical protein
MRDRFTPRQRLSSAVSFEGGAAWYEAELLPDGVLLRADVPIPKARPVKGSLQLGGRTLSFEAELSWVQPGSKWLGSASVVALRFVRIDPAYYAGLDGRIAA